MPTSDLGSLLFLLLPLVFIGYLMLSQRRRVRDLQTLQRSLAVGNRIRTTSGLYGTIAGLSETEVHLQVADGVIITFDRRAIDMVVTASAVDSGSSDTSGPADASESK